MVITSPIANSLDIFDHPFLITMHRCVAATEARFTFFCDFTISVAVSPTPLGQTALCCVAPFYPDFVFRRVSQIFTASVRFAIAEDKSLYHEGIDLLLVAQDCDLCFCTMSRAHPAIPTSYSNHKLSLLLRDALSFVPQYDKPHRQFGSSRLSSQRSHRLVYPSSKTRQQHSFQQFHSK